MKNFKSMLIVILVLLSLLFPTLVYADNKSVWGDPNTPVPSIFGNRVYTREHYTQFYVNEGNGDKFLFDGHCHVFDLKNDFSQGYTAVRGDNNIAPYYLDPLGVPYIDGYWIVSPAYWKSVKLPPGSIMPILPDESSESIYDVPITVVQDSQGVTPRNTIDNNIVLFNNGPNGFEVGAYSGGKPYHWYSENTNSPINITQDFARAVFTTSTKMTTEAKIVFSYIYGLTAFNLQNNGNGTYTFSVFNTTPYIAKNVHLRAYIVQNGKYTLAAETTTDTGPRPTGNGQGSILTPTYHWNLGNGVSQNGTYFNTINWTFSVPVPSGSYQVVATVNISLDEDGTANCEPLVTTPAYGNNSNVNITGNKLYGTKSEVAPFSGYSNSGLNVSPAYSDNYMFSGQQQGVSDTTNTNTSTNGANDLAVTDVQVTDKGNNVKDIKSTFKSSFNTGGYATIRLYDTNNGSAPHFLQSKTIHLKANDTYTIDWGTIQIGSGQYSFIVSIDYYYDDNIKNWDAEQFKGDDGKNYTEQDYSNNKKSADTTGSDISYQPANIQYSESAWYPRLKTVRTPIYKTVTTPVYGWKKVPYIKDQAGNIKSITRIIK
ncbi:MAG: hypothetical protein ACFWT2_12100 [Thermoanaerobacterium thermosaccharolyticum]|jgi:hypothetical protein